MARYECEITSSVLRAEWVLGTSRVPACVGGCVGAQDTYGPLSTRRERTLSIPRSITFMHSPVISTERPWKLSWSYTCIWWGKKKVQGKE